MAVTPLQIKIICETCNGTGVVPLGKQGTNIPCKACDGDGILSYGTIEGAEQLADIADKIKDVLEKCDDILEKLEKE